MFIFFNRLWDDLLALRKRYVGKISAKEVTAFMLHTLPDFYSYLAVIARFAIMEYNTKVSCDLIDKNEIFMVNVGDYMVRTETVYTENKNKNERKLAEWFGEQLYGKYIFGDYTCLDFSGKTFIYTDFRFAQFRQSILKNTDLTGSTLMGVDFRNAIMEGCRMDYCSIHETNFTGAMLKNASFKKARAKFGLTDEKEWKFVGLQTTRFCNADVSSADFSGADLTGADFTGAVLTGANFTDAVLDGAIFDNVFDGKRKT